MKRTIFILVALFIPCGGMAQSNSNRTARVLLPTCNVETRLDAPPLKAFDSYRAGECMGIYRSMFYLGARLPEDQRFCGHQYRISSTGQMHEVVVSYAHRHPEQLDESFMEFVLRAMRNAWPCR